MKAYLLNLWGLLLFASRLSIKKLMVAEETQRWLLTGLMQIQI
jgi:hypothetical protein